MSPATLHPAHFAAAPPRRSPLGALAATALVSLLGLAAGCEREALGPAPRLAPMSRPAAGANGGFRDQLDVTVFQRGNVHTHTTESDGDSDPEEVYAWYRDHGYNFLGLSDHNRRTDPDEYRHVERPGFVAIPAEEITLKPGGRHVHVNAICHQRAIGGRRFGTVEEALRWAVKRARQEGGVALVNHPNYFWAFGAEELFEASGATMLEIWSGHPNVRSGGDLGHPSVESMWDAVLSKGMDIGPAAVDDMHHLGAAQQDRRLAGPGRGWIDVFAEHAEPGEICDAIRRGGFLASNGVRLARLTVGGDAIAVSARLSGGVAEFIGRDGAVLARQEMDPSAQQPSVYRLRGGEGYVRVRVSDASGARAWTQAYRVQ